MNVQKIPRWQWALLGVGVGLLLAASRFFYTPEYFGKSLDENFNVYVAGTAKQPVAVPLVAGAWFGPHNWFYLSDLVVHVPARSAKVSAPVYWITGMLHQVKPATDPKTGGYLKDASGWKYETVTSEEFFHRALTPYKVEKKPYANVMAYLDSLSGKDQAKRYRYAWWEMPAVVWSVYPVAGLIVIGGIWPTVMALMAGAGLGRKTIVSEPMASPISDKPGTTPAVTPPPSPPDPVNEAGFGEQKDQFYPTEVHTGAERKGPA